MENFVCISVTHAEPILSPALDIGHTAADLRRVNPEKLAGTSRAIAWRIRLDAYAPATCRRMAVNPRI